MVTSRPPASSASATRQARSALKKKAHHYHHGDLPRAMLAVTIETIRKHGVAAVTLRAVGDELGVSRTALYRHFANKDALLGAVAREGFATLRTALLTAWQDGSGGQAGFNRMGDAYVRFARQHPSHYQVMFGGYVSPSQLAPNGPAGGEFDAFGVLVDAIVELQRTKQMRADDPQLMALYIWSVVHGVAMLALTGMCPEPAVGTLTAFAIERLRTGTQ